MAHGDGEADAELVTAMARAMSARMGEAVAEVMGSAEFGDLEITPELMLGALANAACALLADHVRRQRELGLSMTNARIAARTAAMLRDLLPAEAH